MQFEIRNRWSSDVQFTAEIDCDLRNAISIAMDDEGVPAGVQALVLKALRQVEARYAQGAAA